MIIKQDFRINVLAVHEIPPIVLGQPQTVIIYITAKQYIVENKVPAAKRLRPVDYIVVAKRDRGVELKTAENKSIN